MKPVTLVAHTNEFMQEMIAVPIKVGHPLEVYHGN
jgi:hypothetical protein